MWKVSLKILNSGTILITFTYVDIASRAHTPLNIDQAISPPVLPRATRMMQNHYILSLY